MESTKVTKRPTYSQVISMIRKEYKCSKEEAVKINHKMNLKKVSTFSDKLKKTPNLKQLCEKYYGRKFYW